MAARWGNSIRTFGIFFFVTVLALPDKNEQYLFTDADVLKVDSDGKKLELNIHTFPHTSYTVIPSNIDRQEMDSSNMAGDLARKETLRGLYLRMALIKDKKGQDIAFRNRLWKKDYIPYEYMNDYQRSILGGILTNGKRVPEALPANYVTGGQIFDRKGPMTRRSYEYVVLNKADKRNQEFNIYKDMLMTNALLPLASYRAANRRISHVE